MKRPPKHGTLRIANEAGDRDIVLVRQATDRTFDVAADGQPHPFMDIAAMSPAASRRITRQGTLKLVLHFVSQCILERSIAGKTQPVDEAKDGRAAGAGTLGKACNRFQAGYRVVIEQGACHALFGRRAAAQAAPHALGDRSSLVGPNFNPKAFDRGRRATPHGPSTPERSTARGRMRARRSAHDCCPRSSPIRSWRISIST